MSISTRLSRIARLAREAPGRALTTLAHHIDVDFLREAYRRTRKDGAVGVDGQTAQEYAQNLEENLSSLLNRFKSGAYKAPPVRRTQIPKGDGSKTRPIGIPTFEDKVLQKAVAMELEAVYEQVFLDCSYGFRPGRSQHQALDALREALMTVGGGWVLEADIEKFFETLDHAHLRAFLDEQVRDGVLRRTINKWLKAGVMEEGLTWHPETGTPQGGVISPLLANIYLHVVLDRWFETEVKPRLGGSAQLIRYADDFVIVFEREVDARRVLAVLPKRFEKYGLRLHPDKTRLVPFRRPRHGGTPKGPADGGPGSFDFLGFTHHWGRSRRGYWVVRTKTAKDRQARFLQRISAYCRRNRHLPIPQQHARLASALRGHYAYYGVTGNGRALKALLHAVPKIWRQWLSRRSQRSSVSWHRMDRWLKRYPLPPVRIVRSIYRRPAKLPL